MAGEEGHTKRVVVAIDFGTTYSGYAFSMKHDYERDPLRIFANQSWIAGTGSLMSMKCPTCILFDENKKMQKFGYEAEDTYLALANKQDHLAWYFFKRFKMKLFRHANLSRDTIIEDEMGKGMKAKDVFASGISYLKKHAEDKLKQQHCYLNDWDIQWVLTVPAIWTDAAKQFMREAAQKAEIMNDQLLIALEPEAAALYCRFLPDFKGSNIFKEGSKYMVIDLGGGTADITAHEVAHDGSLREVHKASGGAWGGIKVDASFIRLLSDIVGDDVMEECGRRYASEIIEIYRDFEVKKRTVKENMEEYVNFRLPLTLKNLYEEMKSKSFDDAVKECSYSGDIAMVADKMKIRSSLVQGLFLDAVSHLEAHIRGIMSSPNMRKISTFILVGGFSESPLVQETLRRKFPTVRTIVPYDSGLAVLKGAVLFGHQPLSISARIAPYTYGVSIDVPFIEGHHPPSKRKVTQNGILCTDVFQKFVEIGDSIDIGSPHTIHLTAVKGCQLTRVRVYQSTQTDPMFVTDGGCSKLGEIKLSLDGTVSRRVEVTMTFGGTEIFVVAKEKDTDITFKAKYDVL